MDLLGDFLTFNWFTVLIALFVCACLYNERNLFYWVNKGIPYSTPVPLFGSMKLLGFMSSNLHENEDYYYKKHGKLYGHVEGSVPSIVVGDPELVYQITIKDFHLFSNRVSFPQPDEMSRKMLFNQRDDDWKRIRSIVTPTFTSGKMRKMAPLINDCLKSLTDNVSEFASTGKSFNLKRFYGAFTMDVIASTAFAKRLDSHKNPDNPFVKNASMFFTRDLSLLVPIFTALPNALYYLTKVIPALNTFDTRFFQKITENILNERRQTTNKDSDKKVDFLQLMVDAGNDMEKIFGSSKASEKTLTEKEIFSQAIAFFVVGYDTTATAISMTTYELAKHPDKQDKLHEEIVRVLSEHKGAINYDSVNAMEYLDAVFSEALRLYPTAPRVDREPSGDYKLAGTNVVLKKGMHVQFPIYSIQRDPKNFEKPLEFIPERFLPDSKLHFNEHAYLPFGAGPRSCVAMRFARMEAKMCLANIFSQFKIKLDTKTKLEYLPGTFLIQPRALNVFVEKR